MLRIFGQYTSAAALMLGIAELLLLTAGFSLASSLALGLNLAVFYVPAAALAGFGIVFAMHAGGLYDPDLLIGYRLTFLRIAFVLGAVFIMAVIATGEMAKYDVVRIYPYRWEWTIGLALVWAGCAAAVRELFAHCHALGLKRSRVLLLHGDADTFSPMEFKRVMGDRLRIVGEATWPSGEAPRHPLVRPVQTREALQSLAHASGAGRVVLAPGFDAGRLPLSLRQGLKVSCYRDLVERETRQVALECLTPEWFEQAPGLNKSPVYDAVKRGFDIVTAGAALVLLAPLLAATALAIRLESPGTILFRQERIGLNGRAFKMVKFRSMVMNAESDRPQWAQESDPRVTRIGRIIRKVRIDELPQLFNVLRGEMSIVGPRPERPYFVAQLAGHVPYYETRHAVKPGITGWAQVNFHYGASIEDAARKHRYDLYYIKNRGLGLEAMTLVHTVRVILAGDGAR